MKAKIYGSGKNWSWKIKNNAGRKVAWGPFYNHRDSAKRGLFRFLSKIKYEFIEFEGVLIDEKLK